MKEELIKLTQEDFEVFAKHKISEYLEIEPHEVYMVWFNYTLGNAKGLFSFDSEKAYPMSNPKAKLPDYVEVTYNKDKHEFYFDWYTKERQDVVGISWELGK
jgi:hypothetical protein